MTRSVKGTEYAAEGMVEFRDDDTVLTLSGDEYTEWVEAGRPAMQVELPPDDPGDAE